MSPSRDASPGAFALVFRNANLRRLQIAVSVVYITAWSWSAALLAYALDAGGPLAVGAVLVCRQIPGALVTPWLAAAGARRPRAFLAALIGVRLLALGGGALSALLDAPIGIFYALAALESLGGRPVRALYEAILPSLVRTPAELVAAGAVAAVLLQAGLLVGAGLSAVTLASGSFEQLFALLAGFVALSLVPLARIGIARAPGLALEAGSAWSQLSRGFAAMRGEPDLSFLLALLCVAFVALGVIQAYAAPFARDLLRLQSEGPALVLATISIGGLVGGLMAPRVAALAGLAGQILLGLVAIGAACGLLTAAATLPVAIPLLGLLGVGVTFYMIAGNTLLIRATPPGVRPLVLGVKAIVALGADALGGGLGASLVSLFGTETSMLLASVFLMGFGTLSARRLRRVEARVRRHDPELSLLGRTPLLRALPMASRELLAPKLRRVDVAFGDTVIRQGDPGDAVFLVEVGRFGAVIDGTTVAELAPGDVFGEIALLEAIPRTASVVALEPGVLWRIDGGDFLETVTGDPDTYRRATALVAERLAASA